MNHTKIIFIILLCLMTECLIAGEEIFISSLKGVDIKNATSCNIEDQLYFFTKNPSNGSLWENRGDVPKSFPYDNSKNFTNIQGDAFISLRWDGSENVVFDNSWSYRLTVKIDSWDAFGNVFDPVTRTIEINYNPGHIQQFKDWDVIRVAGAYKVNVLITKIEKATNGGNYATQSAVDGDYADIYLESKIIVKRVYSLNPAETFIIQQSGSVNTVDRTVTYVWEHKKGMEEYDFEWLFVSSDLDASTTIENKKDFKDATRVTLNQNYYSIELPYEVGRLYFRVRAIGYGNELNHQITTKWMYPTTPAFITVGPSGNIGELERDKNWTYRANYAEQGKRSEVLSFADGTGRGRQNITKDNSTNKAIVAESVFDREGRMAINVLPSVADNHQILFYRDYNLIQTKPIHWTHFDKDTDYALGQGVILDDNTGSSRYFSPNNPNSLSSKGAFIADAEGYPYTQTVFDNQGRLKMQTGVGDSHRLGSGHETKYYYSGAFQEDLDELFGSEVGYAEHYKMMMVEDPNGQKSISYTNLSNQVVATALLGTVPVDASNNPLVDALDASSYNYDTSPTSRKKKVDFVRFNQAEFEETTASWVVRKEFLAASDGNYDFHYSPFVTQNGICYNHPNLTNCDFQLSIKVFDSEGNIYNDQIVNIQSSNPFVGNLKKPFDVVGGEIIKFTLPVGPGGIPTGSYIIEKRLQLKDISTKLEILEQGLETYKEDYLEQLEIYYKELAEGNLSATFSDPNGNGYEWCINLDSSAIVPNFDNCQPVNNSGSALPNQYCDYLEKTLKQDLLPGGQYFDNTPNPSSPNLWLSNNMPSGHNWTTIKSWTYEQIKDYMESNQLFNYHPEWCHYNGRCLDKSIGEAQTWYEKMLDQDIVWQQMSTSTADINDYLELPNQGQGPFCVNPGGTYYASTGYKMLADLLALIPLTIPTSALEDNIKYDMCHHVQNGGTYYDIAHLASLGSSSVTLDDQWRAIRAMMIDIKRKNIDTYFKNNGCPFLQDADSLDNIYYTASGYKINVVEYRKIEQQVAFQTGIQTNGTNQNTQLLSVYATQTLDEYALCGYLKSEVVFDCGGGVQEITINASFSPGTYTAVQPSLVLTGASNIDCPDQATAIQTALNNWVASWSSSSLKDDAKFEVLWGPTLDKVRIILRLPGQKVDASGNLVDNTFYEPFAIGFGGTYVPVERVSCDLNYTTCTCEELNSLIVDPTLLAIATGGTTIEDVIASKYNHDLGLTAPYIISASDIIYIMEGYCGRTPRTITTFPNFPVSIKGTPQTVTLPLDYTINTLEQYELWKAAVKADPRFAPEVIGKEVHKSLGFLFDCVDSYQNDPVECIEEQVALALYHSSVNMDNEIQKAIEEHRKRMLNDCMVAPPEEFSMEYVDKTLHYTLYYYDVSGNLERTIPPLGVKLIQDAPTLASAKDARVQNLTAVTPGHRMSTSYEYNTLNQGIASVAPDRGLVKTYYDILGRPILSQNDQQRANGTANYLIYDNLGRVIETGLIHDDPSVSLAFAINATGFQNVLNAGGFPNVYNVFGWTKTEIRTTTYSEILLDMEFLFDEVPDRLRNFVGGQTYSMDGQSIDYKVAYNYDVFGNAKEIWQYYKSLHDNQYKQLTYEYDLISGVVQRVDYQKSKRDQLSHRYTYDAMNRLTKAESSLNGFIWNTESKYEYYLHGPLQRVEIGNDKVQGMDYVYTMQGWIKSVNTNTLNKTKDPGRDSYNASNLHIADIHSKIATDIYGYTVHYFSEDYQAINAAVQNYTVALPNSGAKNLFNGNISAVTQAQTKPFLAGQPQQPLDVIWKNYRYDQLHRLKEATTLEVDIATLSSSGWTSAPGNKYQTNYSYDPNGNILSLNRHSGTTLIDQLTYYYTGTTKPTNTANNFANTTANIVEDNKLLYIKDIVSPAAAANDIETQCTIGCNPNDNLNQNYDYDLNGSLIKDKSEDIELIEWTSEQKVHKVIRTTSSLKDDLEYVYDFQGNRISKIRIPKDQNLKDEHTVYVRDPQGNVLAIYEYQQTKGLDPQGNILQTPAVMLKEQMVYGSDRIGVIKRLVQTGGPIVLLKDGEGTTITSSTSVTLKMITNSFLNYLEGDLSPTYAANSGTNVSNVISVSALERSVNSEIEQRIGFLSPTTAIAQRLERLRGKYSYEIKNFRGDIRQIISDIKVQVDNGDGTLSHYEADVRQVTDNYSFGWEIAERTFTVDDHRFGFNGKENDREWGGQLIQDYGFRLYNPAIGKFLSVDPLSPDYPELTTYQFASNNPIMNIDLDGLEGAPATVPARRAYRPQMRVIRGGKHPANIQSIPGYRVETRMVWGKGEDGVYGFTIVKKLTKTSPNEYLAEHFQNRMLMSEHSKISPYAGVQDHNKLQRILEKASNFDSYELLTAHEQNYLNSYYKQGGVPVEDVNFYTEILYGVEVKRVERNTNGGGKPRGLVQSVDELADIYIGKLSELSDVQLVEGKESSPGSMWHIGKDQSGALWKLEYEPEGHGAPINEGPHVKFMKADDTGKMQTMDKFFIEFNETK